MTGDPETRPPLDLTRPMIESEIERLLSILDWLDPDPDIEDEGAQCDDEGWIEEDCGLDEDDPGRQQWGGAQLDEQEATTRACVGVISRVRHLQQRNGQKPIEPLRVLGGVTMKGGRP